MTEKRKTGRPTKTQGQKDTTEKIFEVAINLFAQRGYDNVSIRDIAAAVGIKESSIYKHYTSKEQIFQKIIEYPLSRINTLAAREDTTEQLIAKMGYEGFMSESGIVFTSWMTDPKNEKIWRIFYIELYHNEQIKQAYINLIKAGKLFWTTVFSIMIKQKLIKPSDPNELASEFLAFFWNAFMDYFLVHYGKTSGSFLEENMDSFARHITYFIKKLGEKQ